MRDFTQFRVRNDVVWQQIKYLFIGALTLFLINVFFGFDNALTEGELPRWQLLIHLHAGSIGWITLSVITMAVWIFSGNRELSAIYVSRVRLLTRVVIFFFGGYIISFGLSFSQGGGFFALLPIFGTLSALTIWSMAAFAVTQYRKSETKSAPELMVMSGLLIASLGALMGVLLGLENALSTSIIPGADRIGAHAGVMDGYLLLGASAIVEWFFRGGSADRYSRGALAQTILFGLAPLVVWLGLIVNVEMLAGLSAPLILLGVIAFAVRNFRQVVAINPLKSGPGSWVFFGSIWTVIWALIFAYLINVFITQGEEGISPALGILFVHSAFVGTMTCLILGACSVRGFGASNVLGWAEPLAPWLVNLGLVVFILFEFISDSRLGAIVMGTGVLLGVATMVVRMLSEKTGQMATAPTD